MSKDKRLIEHKHQAVIMAVVLCGAFITTLNQTLLSTALPSIMEDLGITASTGQWLTTIYMLVSAIMVPLSALILERFPTKRLFMVSMITYGIGTILCAISSSFGGILLGRIIQGLGAGIILPLLYTVIFLIYPLEKRGGAMGLVGLVIGVAPAIGPTLSGWIVDNWHWKVSFVMLIPIILLVVIFASYFMRDVVPLKKHKFHIPSILLSTLGFGATLYGFSIAGDRGWTNPAVISTILLGILLILAFARLQLKMENPMLELRVFKSKAFTLTTIMGTIVNLTIIGATLVLPIYVQTVRGESAMISGLLLLPGAIFMSIFSPISGKLFDKYGIKKVSIVGITILCITTIPFISLNQGTSLLLIMGAYALRMIGISFVIMPLQTEGINALPNKLIAHGTAVSNTFRQVILSIGTALLITIMTNVTNWNKPNLEQKSSNPEQYQTLLQEASLKGINATFLITLILCITCMGMIYFIGDKGKKSKAESINNMKKETSSCT